MPVQFPTGNKSFSFTHAFQKISIFLVVHSCDSVCVSVCWVSLTVCVKNVLNVILYICNSCKCFLRFTSAEMLQPFLSPAISPTLRRHILKSNQFPHVLNTTSWVYGRLCQVFLHTLFKLLSAILCEDVKKKKSAAQSPSFSLLSSAFLPPMVGAFFPKIRYRSFQFHLSPYKGHLKRGIHLSIQELYIS